MHRERAMFPVKITAPGYAIKFPFPTIAATKNSCAELQATMGSWPAGRVWPLGFVQQRCRGVVTNSNHRQEISKDWSHSPSLQIFSSVRGVPGIIHAKFYLRNYSKIFFCIFLRRIKVFAKLSKYLPWTNTTQNDPKFTANVLKRIPFFYVPVPFPNGRLILPKCHQTGVLLGKLHLSLGIVAFLPFVQKQKPHFYLCKIYHRPK